MRLMTLIHFLVTADYLFVSSKQQICAVCIAPIAINNKEEQHGNVEKFSHQENSVKRILSSRQDTIPKIQHF